MKKILLPIITIITFSACEKELTLNLKASEPELVVEGTIKNGNYPAIILTNSVGFFDKIDASNINYVKDANISVTNLTNNTKIPLTHYQFDTTINGKPFQFCFYSVQFTNPTKDSVLGKIGSMYQLDIEHKGKKYSSITKIPNQALPDSIWFSKSTDTTYQAMVKFTDPDTIGNYVRLETKINRKIKSEKLSENWLTPYNSVFTDAINNGKTLSYPVNLGYTKNLNLQNTEDRKIFNQQNALKIGDTLHLKYNGITFATYSFWSTLEYSRNSTGNPFGSPTKVQGNIKGCTGIWAGYGSREASAVVK